MSSDEPSQLAASDLLFTINAEAQGEFRLYEGEPSRDHRLAVWSCNQPFDTDDNGQLTLWPTTAEVLEWYQQQLEQFQPDLIWGLGDTAYADGTDASNFIDHFYDHPARVDSTQGQRQLLHMYREMYLGHWRFQALQKVMRSIPHLCVWDDHEIRDGWGSEAGDFDRSNARIYSSARQVAEEFILSQGPRVRPADRYPDSDAHQSYVDGSVAAFLFDGRSSRRYHKQNGHVLSEEQFQDFRRFCEWIARTQPQVRFLLMGCGVPFINLKDYIESLGSKLPKAVSDAIGGLRDDIRDSWNSPGNRKGLRRLIGILRDLRDQRPEIEIVNVSGDIHVANAFSFQPLGFTRAMYQITSSGLTNRQHVPELVAPLLYIEQDSFSETLGYIHRLWDEVTDPNLLLIERHGQHLRFVLKVFQTEYDGPEPRPLDGPSDRFIDVGRHRIGFPLLP